MNWTQVLRKTGCLFARRVEKKEQLPEIPAPICTPWPDGPPQFDGWEFVKWADVGDFEGEASHALLHGRPCSESMSDLDDRWRHGYIAARGPLYRKVKP